MPHVYRWDLDKTYLQTDFDSLTGLVKAALQSAEEKKNIPGTGALMRELRYGPDGQKNRVMVVSGSPRQMRRVLERKLQLDGADVESLTLKPNVGNILRLRFRAVRDQLGYKLPALLENRARMGQTTVRETCFGDDAEMDGLVYRLYADICARRVQGPALRTIMEAARLYPDQMERISSAAMTVVESDPVERICIHLETGSPTARFSALGRLVAPTFNTFQASLVLHADGRLSAEAAARIADVMVTQYGYTRPRLSRSLEDALRRAIVTPEHVEPLLQSLGMKLPVVRARPALGQTEVDYVAMLQQIHAWHDEVKKKRRRPTISSLLGLE